MSANPRSLGGEEIDADPEELQHAQDEAVSALMTVTPLYELVTDAKWSALESWLTRMEWDEIERLTTAESTAAMVRAQARISVFREVRSLPAVTIQTVAQLNDALEASEGEED